MVVPGFFAESPALVPSQFDEPCAERRRLSVHNECDAEASRVLRPRAGSISPFDLDADKDRFRRPKEQRPEESSEQYIRREVPMEMASPGLRLMLVPEERTRRIFLPLNPGYAALPSPLLAPHESMRYLAYQPEFMQEQRRKASGMHMGEMLFSPGYAPFVRAGQSDLCAARVPVQDCFRLDGEAREGVGDGLGVGGEKRIGGLTVSQRKEKIQRYLKKRESRIWRKKISYDCRKKVADKRLRIKGRFVTREQAFELLGATPEDLASNKLLQELVHDSGNCSIVTSARNMKIRNIQTLLSSAKKDRLSGPQPEKEIPKDAKMYEKEGVKVEVLNKNTKEQTVEIRIEPLGKPQSSQREELEVPHKVFEFTRLKPGEFNPVHSKYHKE